MTDLTRKAVAEFVGTMNRIPAVLTPRGATLLGRVVDVHDRGARATGDRVTALVRPEGLTVTKAPAGAGIVSGKTFLGSVTRLLVLLSDTVSVHVDFSSVAAASIGVGDPVDVNLIAPSVLVTDAT